MLTISVGSEAVLISIRPPYAERILRRQKIIEYRKTAPALPLRICYLYESLGTKPVGGLEKPDAPGRQRIIGEFVVARITENPAGGFRWHIESARRYERLTFSLADFGFDRPPQDWRYVPAETARRIQTIAWGK